MKKFLAIVCIILITVIVIESIYIFQSLRAEKNNVKEKILSKPLMSYAFENLKNTKFPKNNITIGQVVDEEEGFVSRMFYFNVPKKPNSNEMQKVSGLINIPKQDGTYPVIVMFRGFIPEEDFKSGAGTQPSAKEFAKSGFVTLAPDFLGFGESASPSADSFEARFQTYTTALTLLSSIDALNNALDSIYFGSITVNLQKIGIWGHSNGGHIALSALAISGLSFPTVLWAPVSKSFPYSILYYTDESDDQGKSMRKYLADFEKIYDISKFSPTNYYKWIIAPIQISQGTMDEEIPFWWTNELVQILEDNNVNVEYFKYSGANHNLQPSGWSSAVSNAIDFYKRELSD